MMIVWGDQDPARRGASRFVEWVLDFMGSTEPGSDDAILRDILLARAASVSAS